MHPARALFADATLKIGAIVSLLGWFVCLLLAVAQRDVWLMLLFAILGLLAVFSRWYCMDPLKARQIRRETAYDRARRAADRLSPGERAALCRYLDEGQ
jgi:hypothetical protein